MLLLKFPMRLGYRETLMSKYVFLVLITFSSFCFASRTKEMSANSVPKLYNQSRDEVVDVNPVDVSSPKVLAKYATKEDIAKKLNALEDSEKYTKESFHRECDSFVENLKTKKITGKVSSTTKKHLSKYKECNEEVGKIKTMVELDGVLHVDSEAYLKEIKRIIEVDHEQFVKNHKDRIMKKISGTITSYTVPFSSSDIFKQTIESRISSLDYTKPLATEETSLPLEFGAAFKSEGTKNFLSETFKSSVNTAISFDGKSQIISVFLPGSLRSDFKTLDLSRESMESTDYIQETFNTVTEANNSEKETIVVINEAYISRLASLITTKICGIKIKADQSCDSIIESLGFSGIFNHKNMIDESSGMNFLALESFKMMGHWYALRKLEKYIVDNQNIESFSTGKENSYQSPLGSTCVRNSRYTVDFKACRNMAGAQNLYRISSIADQVGSGLATSLQNQSAQKKYASAVANGEDSTKAGLDVLADTHKSSSTIAAAAGAAYGGAASTMTAMLSTYPSQAKFSRKCENQDRELDYCYLLQHVSDEKLFANAKVKAQSWNMVGSLAGEAIKHGMEALHFSDLAKQTKGIKDDYTGALEEVATIGFENCNTNPELCDTNTATETSSTFGLGNFSLGSNGFKTQAFSQNTNESTGDIDTSTGISKTEAASLSKSLNDGGDSLSGDFTKIAAGDLGGRRSAGSGGSGGGASASGGGGSSGGGSSSGNSSSSGAGGVPKIKSAWQKGGNVSSIRGGKVRKKKKTSPYGNLFNKSKKGRNIASDVNDIADKSSKLFEKISKRYEDLSSKNRLKSF